MKKTIKIFLLVLLTIPAFTQETNKILKVSEYCGKDLAKKIQSQELYMKKALNTQNTLKIVILPIKNHENKITSISIDLAKNLTNIIQQYIKPLIPNFETYIIEYSYIKNNKLGADYTVETIHDKALTKIKVKVSAREKNKSFGLYFSYADIHIEIIDINTENIIFVKDYSVVGGSQISYNEAAQHILKDILNSISNEIIEKLSNI